MTFATFGLFASTACLAVAFAGILVRSGGFRWVGHLPGDLLVDRGGPKKVLLPVSTTLVFTAFLSLTGHVVSLFLIL